MNCRRHTLLSLRRALIFSYFVPMWHTENDKLKFSCNNRWLFVCQIETLFSELMHYQRVCHTNFDFECVLGWGYQDQLLLCPKNKLQNECHSRGADGVAIVRILHIHLFVIPGLTRNPLLFRFFTLRDAGSVIPDSIRDRHDWQRLSVFLNCDTVWEAGGQKTFFEIASNGW